MSENVLSRFGQVEGMSDERMAKETYAGKVNGKKGKWRPRLTLIENSVSKILSIKDTPLSGDRTHNHV